MYPNKQKHSKKRTSGAWLAQPRTWLRRCAMLLAALACRLVSCTILPGTPNTLGALTSTLAVRLALLLVPLEALSFSLMAMRMVSPT